MNRYCIGHSITDVAKRVGKTLRWVQTRLEYYAAQTATGGIGSNTPIIGKQRGALEDVSKVVREFTPNVNVKLIDDGKGSQSIGSIEGDDSEEFAPYLEHYVQQGHEPAAAIRLAKAEWADEEAVEAGVIPPFRNSETNWNRSEYSSASAFRLTGAASRSCNCLRTSRSPTL